MVHQRIGQGISGWRWFALHLCDGTDLMLYQLWRVDNPSSRFLSKEKMERWRY